MKCPYLTERALTMCAAASVTYLPSILEIAEYCTVHRHEKCFLYKEAAENGAGDPTGLDRWPIKPFYT